MELQLTKKENQALTICRKYNDEHNIAAPIPDLAESMCITTEQARKYLRRFRRMGVLSRSPDHGCFTNVFTCLDYTVLFIERRGGRRFVTRGKGRNNKPPKVVTPKKPSVPSPSNHVSQLIAAWR